MAAMNMEEWQRKLRAEKEAARQKKTESAEILRGYRGEIKDEDLKLKILREEERKRQLDAQNNLHNYKNTQIQEGLSKPKGQRPDQHYPTPVNAGDGSSNRDVMDGIVMGSVSERAAVFDSATVESPTTPSGSHSQQQQPNNPDVSANNDSEDVEPTMPPTTDLMGALQADPFASTLPVADPFSAGSTGNDSLAGSMAQTLESSDAAAVQNDPFALDPAVQVPFANESSVEDPFAATASATPESTSVSTPAVPVSTTPALSIAESNGTVSAASLRIEALFSFGLVTIRTQPELSSYMAAVQSVVTATSNNGSNLFQYESSSSPYVKDMQWDSTFVSRTGRSDVRRMVVTAAVPIIVKDETMIATAKSTLVGALQASIQSGDFLLQAQGH